MFEKYSNDDMIVINSDVEEEEDEPLSGFMPSHLGSGMDSSRNSLATLMQRAWI